MSEAIETSLLKEKWDATVDGALSELAMYRKFLRRGVLAVNRQRRPAGEAYSHPAHGTGQLIGLVSGQFQMDIGDRQFVLRPGDMLYIPANVAHSGRVLGCDPAVYLKGGADRPARQQKTNGQP